MTEWYRKKTWTKDDELEYFAKLSRARKDGRAQFLKVQAIELTETKKSELMNVAEKLINKLFTEYPDNKIDRSAAFQTLGNIYKYRQMIDDSIYFYKKAIEFEEVFPTVLTQAYLDYSELVVKFKKKEQFEFVEKIILERIQGSVFPLEKYKAYSILSIINIYKGHKDKADQYKVLADHNADAKTSGLKYHNYLGIVTERDSWFDTFIKRFI